MASFEYPVRHWTETAAGARPNHQISRITVCCLTLLVVSLKPVRRRVAPSACFAASEENRVVSHLGAGARTRAVGGGRSSVHPLSRAADTAPNDHRRSASGRPFLSVFPYWSGGNKSKKVEQTSLKKLVAKYYRPLSFLYRSSFQLREDHSSFEGVIFQRT